MQRDHEQFCWRFRLRESRVKLSPKCNLGCFCDGIWVKPSCKNTITTRQALLRFTVFLFSGQTHFQWECYRYFSDSIKISIVKTLRRLDTTWNFARSIIRVSTHEYEHWEHGLPTQFTKKKVFEQLTLAVACSASRHPASWEVCDLTWRRDKLTDWFLGSRTYYYNTLYPGPSRGY